MRESREGEIGREPSIFGAFGFQPEPTRANAIEMLQLIVLLAASWILIWIVEKGDLSVLGLRPTRQRFGHASILFLLAAACCSAGYLTRMLFAEERFILNPAMDTGVVLGGVWLNVSSVLFEELLCRGVGLYLLIKLMGRGRAVLISALVFALLHWLNAGVFGNALQMLLVFAFTFTMGLLLAYAYARTSSLYYPFAIHIGWNLVQNFIFPDGPFGNTLLVQVLHVPEVTVSYAVFLSIFLFPKLAAIVLNFLAVRRMTPAIMGASDAS